MTGYGFRVLLVELFEALLSCNQTFPLILQLTPTDLASWIVRQHSNAAVMSC